MQQTDQYREPPPGQIGNRKDTQTSGELGIPGFTYCDLYDSLRLGDLLAAFEAALAQANPELSVRYEAYRASGDQNLTPKQVSDLLVQLAPHVGHFVARLFGIESTHQAQAERFNDECSELAAFRRHIVEAAAEQYKGTETAAWNLPQLESQISALTRLSEAQSPAAGVDDETVVARIGVRSWRLVEHYQRVDGAAGSEVRDAEKDLQALRDRLSADDQARVAFADALSEESPLSFATCLLDVLRRWSFAVTADPRMDSALSGWVGLRKPAKVDFDELVPVEASSRAGYHRLAGPAASRRRRDGFGLTDKRFPSREIAYEVNHCIYCHQTETDYCAKGMRNRKTGVFKINPLGVIQTGCPLDEKISEMHLVKREGDDIGALALIMIDNPMVPGTGHRICNDCMKACIYQKTEPVNIPQIETNVLTDVLFMPYGFEIYSLFTRWNPLNTKRPHALPYNGKNVLVVGLGPAGYTLAHYLLNEGFAVAGIDALKIEPLPVALTGDGTVPPAPIRDFGDLYEDLDKRVMAGFGGVAEYGITVRWDKNFLKVIYLTLARRETFLCYGGVRFGGTLSIDDAWRMGFDHIALATGAGKPTIANIKNNLIRGIRKASDFLMALQLTGAAKASSLANLQVRLPAGVIGGGLTAIDTATELMAYYPVQVEAMLHRFQTLTSRYGQPAVLSRFDAEEHEILEEFLTHGRLIQAERERALASGEAPDFQTLIQQWGGVTLYYRKALHDAPAYRQNHEEIVKALEEGISIAEQMNPIEALADGYGHLRAIRFEKTAESEEKWSGTGEEVEVPLRSLLVAAGTSPNIIYEHEYPGTFELDGQFFQRFEITDDPTGATLHPEHDVPWPKVGKPAPFTSYQRQGKYITYYGDNHPVYAGNVVKAMASARDGYPYVVKLFESELRHLDPAAQSDRDDRLASLKRRLDEALRPRVVEVSRLTPSIIEVLVRAPMQARKFYPGQFYRVQNFESLAATVNGTTLVAEGLALTGAWVDKERGLISLIVLEMGTSSRLCALWKPEEPLVVMGVTGAPTEVPHGKNILLAGGGLGNAVLFSIGKALRAAGNKVVYFAGYKDPEDVFKVGDIEAASDIIVWSVDPGPGRGPIPVTRPQDKSIVANIVEAMVAYAAGELGDVAINLTEIDSIITIGSDRMMSAVQAARHDVLKPYLKPGHTAIGSINSPMQCMMKGVCAQCLCKHVDPDTGDECFVYSCYNQDQPLDRVDFANLHERLRQNSVQEKLADMWLDYLLEERCQ